MPSLQVKHRPKTLDDIYGNEEAVASLSSILARKPQDRPSSFLFVGPHGCGKTTMARIAAKKLGCVEQDFVEMDSAQFRGIGTIRELRQASNYMPTYGDKRGWLLDECHQLSKDAQNGLLKLLEDTPGHVCLLLATTEPSKLLPTIRSRCHTFVVDNLDMDETLSMLKKICIKEKKKPSLKVLKQIAIDSMGCPRDALVILDSVIDLPKEKMLRAAKRSAEEKSQIIELSRALLKGGDWKKVSGILRGLNAEPETIRRNVLSYMNSVLLNGSSARAYEVADLFLDPFYDSGAAGLTCACFEATFSTTQE